MIRLSQPSIKCFALLRASTTARASPSISAYRDSAEWVNLLPASVLLHPKGHHVGVSLGHRQCFCGSQNPRPSLLQSVMRQVLQLLLKMTIPSLILSMMTRFDLSDRFCSWSSQ